MAVHLPVTTDESVDKFERDLADLVRSHNLEAGAQLPAFTIAHILRHTYETLRKDPVCWSEVFKNGEKK